MPLAVLGLKAAIIAAEDAVYGPAAIPAEQEKFAGALAKAIVEYIQANALVTGTVTSGAGSGGTVTGTVG